MAHFDTDLIEMIRSHPDTDVGEGATAAQIEAAQSEAGFTFPTSYVEFLQHFNGGTISYMRLFGVGRTDELNLITARNEMAEYIPAVKAGNMFPFAKDWGGSCECFDLTFHGTGEPNDDAGEFPIYFWNHEFSEERADEPYVWSCCHASFPEFIRSLYE